MWGESGSCILEEAETSFVEGVDLRMIEDSATSPCSFPVFPVLSAERDREITGSSMPPSATPVMLVF
jgi:hypothetical protein